MRAETPSQALIAWPGAHPPRCLEPAVDEALIRKTADLMIELGLSDVGYEYLIVDGMPGLCRPVLLPAEKECIMPVRLATR